MEERRKEQTRVRMNYKFDSKGIFKPDITSEAETVETAAVNLAEAKVEMDEFIAANSFRTDF